MAPNAPSAKQCVAFGPFRLSAADRLLEKEGVAVPLNSHALDLLIILVERAGEVVSKRDLIARAWPNQTVTESSLCGVDHVVERRRPHAEGRRDVTAGTVAPTLKASLEANHRRVAARSKFMQRHGRS